MAHSARTGRSLRRAMAVVNVARWLAPPDRRLRFVRECHGDLVWQARAGHSLLPRTLSSFPHALALRQPSQGFDVLLQDIRYAVRQLLANPTFALAAVLTLALGIGANATIFSVVNSTLLHPLPFRDGDRMVSVWRLVPGMQLMTSPRLEQIQQWRESIGGLDQIEVVKGSNFVLSGLEEPVEVVGTEVSPGLFELFGVVPERGRTFDAEDLREGRTDLIVIGHELWRGALGGDPEVVGRSIVLDDRDYTIIGVMPAGFRLPSPFAFGRLWLLLDEGALLAESPRLGVAAVARLRPGASTASVNAELAALATTGDGTEDAEWLGTVRSARDMLGDRVETAIWSFQGAVALVLLIACANVANLLLARGTARRRELAVRAALGASRTRLWRQALTESLLLSLTGGSLGLLGASRALGFLQASRPENMDHLEMLRLDPSVVVATLAVALLTGMVFGLLPSLQTSGDALLQRLAGGSRGGEPPRAGRLRSALVLAEVALSTVLLVGAGLLISTFLRAQRIDPGFEADGLLTMSVSLPESRYDAAAQVQFWSTLRKRLQQSLGARVEGLTLSMGVPPHSGVMFGDIELEGLDGWQEGESDRLAAIVQGDPAYREVLRIPLLAGRYLDEHDLAASRHANGDTAATSAGIVINASMARRFGSPQEAIGKGIRFGGDDTPWQPIVGVVGDVKAMGLLTDIGDNQIYTPSLSGDERRIIVRSDLDDAAVVDAVKEHVRALDPALPVSDIGRVRALFDAGLSRERFNASLMTVFAALALVLAVVGIYGVLSYDVEQRRHEIGVRMALGASLPAVVRAVIGRALALVLVGLVAGLAGAGALARWVESMLHGVTPTDPPTYVAAALLLLAVALLAAWIPARRAARTSPIVALRAE